MPWLKRNLLLVIGGVVALGLLGFAGYFFYSKLQLEDAVKGQLDDQTKELERLMKLDPHPGTEKVNNIEAARKQEQDLQAFLAQAQKVFCKPDYPKGLGGGQFRLLLDNTLDDLRRSADRAGVKLPQDYGFTFSGQKTLMAFDQPTIEPLAMALMDIRNVAKILFEARVLSLDGIRRTGIATQDVPNPNTGISEFWNRKPQTNDLDISTPYEFTFRCFTPELAAVLEGLYRSTNFYIVKNVATDTTLAAGTEPDPNAEGGGTGMTPSSMQQMMMMMRYGGRMGGRTMMQPQMIAPVAPPPGSRGLPVLVDEKPFRTILWVDVVRLRDPNEAKAAKAAKPRRSVEPADPNAPPADPNAPAADTNAVPATPDEPGK